MSREIRLTRFNYEPYRNYLSDELIDHAPTFVHDISEINQTLRDCVNLTKICKMVLAAMVDGDKMALPAFHKFYTINRKEYEMGGHEYIEIEIIRKRQEFGTYKSESKTVNKTVALVHHPSFDFKFCDRKIVHAYEFAKTNDGMIDPDKSQVFEKVQGTHQTRHYTSILRFLSESVFGDDNIFDHEVSPKKRESKAQKRNRLSREARAAERERRRIQKEEEQAAKAARKAEREAKKNRKEFEALCAEEIRNGQCAVVPEFDENNKRTGAMIKVANSMVKEYMASHGMFSK